MLDYWRGSYIIQKQKTQVTLILSFTKVTCGILELLFKNSELKSVDMTSRQNINYSRLAVDEDNTGKEATFDPRFDLAPKSLDKVPWKSIVLAPFLFFFGCVLLLLSLFIFTGHMGGGRSQTYGLLGLGTLTFLPSMDSTRLALDIIHGGAHKATVLLPSLVTRCHAVFLVSAVVMVGTFLFDCIYIKVASSVQI